VQDAKSKPVAKITAIGACLLLLICFALTSAWAISGKSPTMDEPMHLGAAWIQTHWHDFRCNPEDPPLWKYYLGLATSDKMFHLTPATAGKYLQLNIVAGNLFFDNMYQEAGNDPDRIFFSSRCRMVLLGVALGAVIACWSWWWGGGIAAIVATAAFCFDPNFLAHAAIIKNDVPITLAFTGLMFALSLLGRRCTIVRWLAVSLLLGAALATKFSGVLAIPVLGLALVCRALIPEPWPVLRWTASTFWPRLLAAMAVGGGSLLFAYVFVWAVYDFRFSVSPDPNAPFDLQIVLGSYVAHMEALEQKPASDVIGQLRQMNQPWHPDPVYRAGQWALAHHALPEAWIVGFLFTYGTSHSRNTFLCGELSETGWWYYFPLAMAFKTPLATLAALGLTMALAIRYGWRAKPEWRTLWLVCAAAIAPVMYFAIAMQSNLNLGLRHVLPVYPFLFIFLGLTAAQAWRRIPRLTATACLVLGAGLIVETYAAFPNYISFFNAAAQAYGPIRLLSDSNLDWGQDLKTLGEWQKAHPDKTVCLYYFGTADPRYYGIKYFNGMVVQSPFPSRAQMAKMHVVIAISGTELQETYSSAASRMFWGQLRNDVPSRVLGNSIYLYDLN
jgi:hypothetical protein